MKKLLITGFDPFGGESINPSWEAVKRLPQVIGEYQVTRLQIPTVFGSAAQAVLDTAKQLQPHAIVCVGQAGGRRGITPEVIGINLRDASIPDNAGFTPMNTPVIPGGPDGLFATVPVRDMVAALRRAEIPAALSYSAGAFVCNDVLYTLLHHFRGSTTQVGFIHVPYLPQQAGENVPSLPLDTIVQGLTLAIQALP